MHNFVHTLSIVLGGTMARQRQTQGSGSTTTRRKPAVESIGIIEVPVHKLAEYVPASFTAASENDADPLNYEGARWYKTGEDKLMLVLGNDQQQFALEFNANALCALSERAKSMSIVDVDDLLELG